MKRIIALGVFFALFTVAASAQRNDAGFKKKGMDRRYETGQLTRGEKFKLHKNDARYHKTKRHFKRDGRISPMEKRKLYKMKRHDRRETFRYRHNDRRRS